jgi:soluble lytic murein transglycosylase-like protein
MSQHGKALAILGIGFAIAVSGLAWARQVTAVTAEAETERLRNAVLSYVAEKNPDAALDAFEDFPSTLIAESQRTGIDHCLALAIAEIESQFRPEAVGTSGEIGLFQMLPTTAAMLEPTVGPFRRPVRVASRRDLGDLADPVVSTRFALAYLRDIMHRKPSIRDALIEYNGGPQGRRRHYYGTVMGAYVEMLERPELGCRFREAPRPAPVLALASSA